MAGRRAARVARGVGLAEPAGSRMRLAAAARGACSGDASQLPPARPPYTAVVGKFFALFFFHAMVSGACVDHSFLAVDGFLSGCVIFLFLLLPYNFYFEHRAGCHVNDFLKCKRQ